MLPKNWNDVLALIVLVLVAGLWTFLSRVGLATEHQGMLIGASIVWIGAIVMYYWRKQPPAPGDRP